MDLDFSCLSVDSSNETHQCNTNYLGKPPIKHACLSIGSSINSNTAECNMDGKIETALCEFSGQSDTNSNKTPLGVPSVIPNVPLLASCQFNDVFGTSRVFGYGESVPYEDIMKPTLTPKEDFCVENDCGRLKGALDRLNIIEKEIVEVMGRRPVVQRIAILQTYKSLYKDNLFAIFNSKLTGYLKDCLIALCYTPAEFDAIELHRAMRGTDTDEDTIIEILCTRTNEQIRRIKNVYPKCKFMPILITRSYGHLRAVFNEYSLISEHDLEEEMRGHAVDCILSIVRCIQNRPRYFAEKLVKATEHTEKDHGTIIRIIVSRCEVDLGRIMEEFLNLKDEQLYKCIKVRINNI
ncbi:unnamed protein product [Schistosoma margrebowiei]|uniref:Uncharacterized protein n=1 Tax=Schistosoma margrebowiei TaxID=48269 RepID=A0A183N6F5_9TREM|nr:unnamed protein product [Schistosoma margrebowiei]